LVGISDPSLERGQAIASTYNVPWYEHFTDLLPHVDAVSVVTPTHLHFPIVAECLRQKVHVLVEKPMVGDMVEARELAGLARRAQTVLQVGHIERFNPAFLELQNVLQDMQIVAINARRLSPFDTSNTDVDVILDLMLHDIDLALTLLGDETKCFQAQGRFPRTDTADYAVATLSAAGGPIATLTASRVTEQKVRQLEVTALGAYIEADLLNKSIYIYRRTLPQYLANQERPVRYRQESLVERIHIPSAEPLFLELQDFARCVREGAKPRVSWEDGLRVLELATEIREQVEVVSRPSRVAPEVEPAWTQLRAS
jgi:predicted dehydrogenase